MSHVASIIVLLLLSSVTNSEVIESTTLVTELVEHEQTTTTYEDKPKISNFQPDTIELLVKNQYIRHPIGVVIDLEPDNVVDVKKLWNNIKHPDHLHTIVTTYDEKGIVQVNKFNTADKLTSHIQHIDNGKSTTGMTMSTVIKTLHMLPFDSMILLFTGLKPIDTDLQQLLTRTLIRKRCMLNVIWTNSEELLEESILIEISSMSGGSSYIVDQDQQQEVILTKIGITGSEEINITSNATNLILELMGDLYQAVLINQEGVEKNLLENISPNKTYTTIIPSRTQSTIKTNGHHYDIVLKNIHMNDVRRDKREIEDLTITRNNNNQLEQTEPRLRFPNIQNIEAQPDLAGKTYTLITGQGKYPPSVPILQQKSGSAEFREPISIEVESGSTLEVVPGVDSTLNFEVTNNQNFQVFATFFARSEHNYIRDVQPRQQTLQPGQKIRIAVYITIPQGGSSGTIDTLSLSTNAGPISVSRSAYLYIQTNPVNDRWNPGVWHDYRGDCSQYRQPSTCENGKWSVEVTSEDRDSGLLKITSKPLGLLFNAEFIAGTKVPVKVTYTGTCCEPRVDIWVEDAKGHYVKKEFDVNYQSLREGEIAAIVLGCVLFVALIILIIVIVVLRRRRNKLRFDLPRHRSASR